MDKLFVRAQELDAIIKQSTSILCANTDVFQNALTLATTMTRVRALLDDEIMAEIEKLQNRPIGFLTDRMDGRKPPYTLDELRDPLIEAILRGFYVCGNEFNVIAQRFYAAKAGLRRKINEFPGVTDFKERLGLPKLTADRETYVEASATWKKDGIPQKLEREFAVKVNAYMGSDGIVGKAARKLYAACLDQMSGIITPEGDLEEIEPLTLPTPTPTLEAPKMETVKPAVQKPEMIPVKPEPIPVKPSVPVMQPVPMSHQAPSPSAKPESESAAKNLIGRLKEAKNAGVPVPVTTYTRIGGRKKNGEDAEKTGMPTDLVLESETQKTPTSLERVRTLLSQQPALNEGHLLLVLKHHKMIPEEAVMDAVPESCLQMLLDDWSEAVAQMTAFAHLKA